MVDKLDAGYTPGEVFALFDPRGINKLDIVSLHDGARELGLVVSRDEVKSALRRMCQLARGEVTRDTFYVALDIDPSLHVGRMVPRNRDQPRDTGGGRYDDKGRFDSSELDGGRHSSSYDDYHR